MHNTNISSQYDLIMRTCNYLEVDESKLKEQNSNTAEQYGRLHIGFVHHAQPYSNQIEKQNLEGNRNK